jgi:hypothetical protein
MRNTHKILSEINKIPVKRPRHREEDNIKIHPREIKHEDMKRLTYLRTGINGGFL